MFLLITICIIKLAFIVFEVLLSIAITLYLWILIYFTSHTVRSLDIEWHSGPGRRVRAWSFHWNKLMLPSCIFKSKLLFLILNIEFLICIVFVMVEFSILMWFLCLIIILIWSWTSSLTGFTLMNNCWVLTVHYICLKCLWLDSWFFLRNFSNIRKNLFLRFWSFLLSAFFVWWNTDFTFPFLWAWMKRLLRVFSYNILLFWIVNWQFYGFLWFKTINLRPLINKIIFFALSFSCGQI